MPEESSHEARPIPTSGIPGAARPTTRRSGGRALRLVCVAGLAVVLVGGPLSGSAVADPVVDLGTAEDFGILAGPAVINDGLTVVAGDVGVSPGVVVGGFAGPPGGTVLGQIHAGDVPAADAQNDLSTASIDAMGRAVPPGNELSVSLDGMTLSPGTYAATSSLELSVGETTTLDGGGDPNAVFIIRAGSSLTAFAGSSISLTNGASACNVFWLVGSSATLGTNSSFAGTIMALSDINLLTGAALNGRALARTGSVTMDANIVTVPTCNTGPTPPTPIVVPSRATGLHVTSRSHRATLYWTRPVSTGGAAIDRYQVVNGSYRRNLTPATRRATFTHLRNGGFWTRAPRALYVRAHNSEGYGKWARATAFPNTPLLFDCAGAHRTPRHFDVTCAHGDSRGYFDRARWTTWTGSTATGTARRWVNTCQPDCAAGNYRTSTVKLRADRVKIWQGPGTDTYFSRLRYGHTTLDHTIALTPSR